MPESKSRVIIQELKNEIVSGKLGRSGDVFMTTRELCARKQISLKTAFRILNDLKADGILEKSGRNHRIASLFPTSGEKGKPLLIGFLATCLENPYFAKLAAHAEEFAHSIGASLIIASSNYNFATECERLKMFCRQEVAGILICPWASTPKQEAFYKELPVPYVMLGRKPETVECDSVLVNNQKAAQEVARHLVAQDVREFAYIGQSGKSSDQRLFGFQAELSAAGVALSESDILRVDVQNQEECRKEILKLLKKKRRGRLGIFCYHDLFAVRTIGLCHLLGLRIPEEVAVAGFDDLPAAAETYPPLTSVSYPVQDIARLGFESLYTRIKFGRIGGGVCRYLDSKLVIRESTLKQNKAKMILQ